MKLQKILSLGTLAIGVLACLFYFISFSEDSFIDTSFVLFYIIIAIALIVVLFFSIASLISNPKGLKRFIMVLIGGAAIIGISYALAGSEEVVTPDRVYSSDVSKNVGMGIITLYFIMGLTIASILFSGILKLFK